VARVDPADRHRKRPAAGDPDVAARFRYFLEQMELTREGFVAAVDGAVTARSLYAVLSGARRPSRALAVLVERTWGFRADFLLHGHGEMWARSERPSVEQLSPAEEDVIAFMRRSVDNAQTVVADVERAKLWEHVFARTMRLIEELTRAAASDREAEQVTYPTFARLVLEECLFLADRYERLAELRHDQRVHQLTDAFVRRFFDQLPRRALDASEHARTQASLAPVRARRRRMAAEREAAITALVRAFEQIGTSEIAGRELLEGSAPRRAVEHRAAIERLNQSAPPELAIAIEELRRTAPEAPTLAAGLARLLDDLVEMLEPRPVPAGDAAEELDDLRRRVVDGFSV